jgi:enoyl-CoA hydratase
MSYETLLYDVKDGVAVITLNRPKNLNAINAKLAQELEEAVDKAADDDGIRVVILTGGDKVFCVGADIKESVTRETSLLRQINVRRNYRFYQKLDDMGKPVIAAIAGHCLGGGLEIAIACDLRIAADNASIGDAHSKIGVIGGAGATARLPRLIGIAKAKEMILLGDPISASEAYRINLVNKVVPAATLLDEAMAMARKLSERPPITLRLAKMCINDGMRMDLLSALEYEQKCSVILRHSADTKEGMKAFAEKRKPVFKGE